MSQDGVASRKVFFRTAFGPFAEGFVCIAALSQSPDVKSRKMVEHFFQYPEELDQMASVVGRLMLDADVYYCPQLFSSRKRKKEEVKECPTAWADLDTCGPEVLKVEPSILVESSPGRWQALWRFETPQAPHVAEDVSRRIAYYHAADGADRSGWDLTQLLRVPGTPNLKYTGKPTVAIKKIIPTIYDVDDFNEYPEAKRATYINVPMPTEPIKESPEELFQKYRTTLLPTAYKMFANEPEGQWSTALWKLEMMLFEAGMSREEVFHIVAYAACNKYRRDGKDPSHLWTEVCRAHAKYQENVNTVVYHGTDLGEMLSEDERRLVTQDETFIERYIDWASGLGDAAVQYHQAGAFMTLSALISGRVSLPTSFGNVVPNLWFMILGDTTLTRKSTAMDIGVELVMEVDPDAILATDGSVEGLMQQLEARPKRPSIFLRDEFSGLLEQFTKRDYMAGMAETLTKLYDGKMQKRVLRKETVTVRDPILLILAGGIRDRIQGLLTHEHVSSGFIPRFIFITAESDTTKLRPLGPPSARDVGNRAALIEELQEMVDHYGQTRNLVIKALGQSTPIQSNHEATLTPEAWLRYNKLENDLLNAGLQTEKPELMTPLFDRLSKSILKAAVLIAASRQREEKVVVEQVDLLRAIRYGEQWRGWAVEIVNGIGRSVAERLLDKILNAIVRRPGISRGQLMQSYHLDKRMADLVFDTLFQRDQIIVQRAEGTGRQTYWPTVRSPK
jgi:hypothetical protein